MFILFRYVLIRTPSSAKGWFHLGNMDVRSEKKSNLGKRSCNMDIISQEEGMATVMRRLLA